MTPNTFFSEHDVKTLVKKLQEKDYNGVVERNNLVLNLIRAKQPISKYQLAKLSNLAYGTIKQICKWATGGDFIIVTKSWSENGQPVQLVSTKKIKEIEQTELTPEEEAILYAKPVKEDLE